MTNRMAAITLSFLFAFLLLVIVVFNFNTPAKASIEPADVTVQSVEWDDMDSHKWIGENWGDTIGLDWLTFNSRPAMQVVITSTGYSWALMRTDAFPSENWENKIALRADIFQVGGASGVDVKLEVRGPGFDPPYLIESIYCNNLVMNTWHTCTWTFNTGTWDYSQVSHLSVVFDHLSNSSPTFYIDNIRLVTATGEEPWDDMDDSSRHWYYFGNWYKWNTVTPFGLELISHNGNNPDTPAGSGFLQWDYLNGEDSGNTSAEIGTSWLDDNRDWSAFNALSATVKVSDPDVPISLFFWDADSQTGFGTPTRKASVANSWQTLVWDIPWPSGFDNTDIDAVRFVVNNLDQHTLGTLYLDNIYLLTDSLPAPVTGLDYVLADFNGRDELYNDFSGNWGVLNGAYVVTTFTTAIHTGDWGASLKVDYNLPAQQYAGLWQSLWGHSDYTETQFIDFTDIFGPLNDTSRDFEQLQFWVRGSGLTTGTHNIKVELKDATNDYEHTAYRYITIDDSDTTWRQIVLDANVNNQTFWRYNGSAPDITRMKQFVLVVERAFNNPAGTFYIENIRFVDADEAPFDPNQHTNDEFYDFVSEKTFQYFLDWYDPNTGLFQDRSVFPNVMSTASTGFGLTALAIGESRGWVTHAQAVSMITRTLNTLSAGQSPTTTVGSAITGTNGYKGFYYHFLGTDGLRINTDSELSPVDTALLLAGVITVREYFNDVPEIVALAESLYERVQWDWMLDATPDLFYLAWKPECGLGYTIPAPGGGCFTSKQDGSPLYWDYYTDEVILINILAIGSPTHSVPPDVFYVWTRDESSYANHSLVHSWNGSLFTYFFAHLWLDFNILGTDHHPTNPVDWWDNSVEATKASWNFAVDHQDSATCDGDDDYTTYGPLSWGLTAADGITGYHAYGALPVAPGTNPVHDGTIAPYGAGSVINFVPVTSTLTLKHYFTGTDLWRYRMGFGDAYNLDPNDCGGRWYNHATFGIDQGPMLIALENQRSGLVWNNFRQNEWVQQALCKVYYCPQYLPLLYKD